MMNHTMMNHTMMNHTMMNHTGMDHSHMNLSHETTGGPHMHQHGMDMNMSQGCVDHSGHGMEHSGDGMEHSMDMHGMKMFFHVGYEEYVLFEECLTKSEAALGGACVIIFAVAVLYEGLKFLRELLLQRSLMAQGSATQYLDNSQAAGGASQEKIVMQTRNMSVTSRMFSGDHLLQTVLHVVQVFISYCLMLVFMTYNVWLCLAVVLGAGVGYFLFGWKRAVVVDSNEHCH